MGHSKEPRGRGEDDGPAGISKRGVEGAGGESFLNGEKRMWMKKKKIGERHSLVEVGW